MITFQQVVKLAKDMRQAQIKYFITKEKGAAKANILKAAKNWESKFKEAFYKFMQSKDYSEAPDGTTASKHLLLKQAATHLLDAQELAFKELKIANKTAHAMSESRQQEKEFDKLLEWLSPTQTQIKLF